MAPRTGVFGYVIVEIEAHSSVVRGRSGSFEHGNHEGVSWTRYRLDIINLGPRMDSDSCWWPRTMIRLVSIKGCPQVMRFLIKDEEALHGGTCLGQSHCLYAGWPPTPYLFHNWKLVVRPFEPNVAGYSLVAKRQHHHTTQLTHVIQVARVIRGAVPCFPCSAGSNRHQPTREWCCLTLAEWGSICWSGWELRHTPYTILQHSTEYVSMITY
jgi:hypothetical protein